MCFDTPLFDEGLGLRKLEEYLRHAAECREMARTASPTHRSQLEQMADTREELAAARKRQLARQAKAEEDNESSD